jgi:branched-chain amino acid transport system substrate-binding protein
VRKKSVLLALLALLIGALALTAAGCGGDDDEAAQTDTGGGGGGGGGVEELPSSSCTKLEYGGEGEPDVLVASDLPLQGSSRTQTTQMTKAIRKVLEDAGWKAGDLNVAYQSCDDSTAQAGKWDSGKCSQNGKAYAENEKVMAVIGTFNSGCAQIIIPLLNRAPGGGVGMVSPANTYVCLTEAGPGCAKSEPDKYYPSGKRNYTRIVAHDAYQGAALAQFAQNQGLKKCFVLNDKEAYGLGVAQNFQNAAKSLGIEIAGFEAWDPKASSYEGLMRKISGTGADCLMLGGLIDENGAQVIKDKVAVLGPNTGKVKLLMPDGFTTQSTIDEAGKKNAAGAFSSVAGVPPDQLTGKGKEFIESFKQELGGEPVEAYSAYGAQAMQIVLDAISRAGADRGKVIDELFNTTVQGGILGDFEISENGDPTSGPITVYVAKAQFDTQEVITPDESLVEAAKGGA